MAVELWPPKNGCPEFAAKPKMAVTDPTVYWGRELRVNGSESRGRALKRLTSHLSPKVRSQLAISMLKKNVRKCIQRTV